MLFRTVFLKKRKIQLTSAEVNEPRVGETVLSRFGHLHRPPSGSQDSVQLPEAKLAPLQVFPAKTNQQEL